MTTTQLTPAQHAILAYALEHTDGKIDWFPDNIKGGARKKVLDGLFNRALITTDGSDWFVAAEGYDAMGRARPAPATLEADPEIEAAVTAAEATWAKDATTVQAMPRTRENSKQAEVIRMLQRPEGATIAQICGATGWQAHTVRGTFAGAFKKKLGLNIVSDKAPGGERIYRIA
jgi:crotonobetainyl-CoA:carnitine CoA-transferase CaiB-like acyl-CoA transferase